MTVICFLLLSACTSLAPLPTPTPAETRAAAPANVLKIGVVAPLTGLVASFGASTRAGVELAIDEWNARGGLLGQPVVLVWEDSQCIRDPAVNAANQLIHEQGVRYMIGDVCSGGSLALAQIAEAEGVVMITPASTNEQVTLNAGGSTRQYVFRACYTDSFQGSVDGKFAVQDLRLQRAFILTDPTNDYTLGLAQAFEKAFTAGGGEIVGRDTYSLRDSDFSVIFAHMREAQPQIIFLGDSYQVVNLIARQARQKGIHLPFIGADGWDSPELDRRALEGSYFTNHFSPDDQRPAVQVWLKKYRTRYQAAPDGLAALGYDAANLLLAAIEKAGVDDPARVAQALAGLTWQGVTGTIAFDAQHNPLKPAVILQVRDGEIRHVTTVMP